MPIEHAEEARRLTRAWSWRAPPSKVELRLCAGRVPRPGGHWLACGASRPQLKRITLGGTPNPEASMPCHARLCTSNSRPLLPVSLFVSLLLLSTSSAAAQWTMFSDQERLRGKTIVDVGELSHEMKFIPGRYEAGSYQAGKSVTWYQFRGQRTVCADEFAFSGASSDAALLLSDEKGHLYMASLKTSIGSIDVDVTSFVAIACPSPY